MRERVNRADREGYFPPDLIGWMNLLCRLRMRYRLAYFAVHPDPYTERPVEPALIDLGLSGLEAMPFASRP